MKKIIMAGASALVLSIILISSGISGQNGSMTGADIGTDFETAMKDSKEAAIFSSDASDSAGSSATATPAPTRKPTPGPTPEAAQKAASRAAAKPAQKAAPKAKTAAKPTSKPTAKPASKPAPKPASAPATSGVASKVIATAKSYLGVPYVWGGASPSGFDCSGFINYVYGKHGISLPRVTSDLYKAGTGVSKSSLKPGDLVFFETYKPGPSHVGIYLGGSQFIHASSGSEKVIVSSLGSSYYTSHYIGSRRVL